MSVSCNNSYCVSIVGYIYQSQVYAKTYYQKLFAILQALELLKVPLGGIKFSLGTSKKKENMNRDKSILPGKHIEMFWHTAHNCLDH